MQSNPYPPVLDLVLIGGGHSHALILRRWAMQPMPGVRLTVINPDPTAPYTGMLPGFVAGHYTRPQMMIDLVRLARMAGARLILDAAIGIDLHQRRISLANRPPIRFDRASIDVGIGSGLPDIPGFAQHAVAAKPLGDFAVGWDRFLSRAAPDPHVVILGAGIGGIELAMAARHRLHAMGLRPVVTLIDPAPEILTGMSHKARTALMANLSRQGVSVRLGQYATAIHADRISLQDDTEVRSDFTLSVTGARPHDWLKQTGLGLTDGFVTVGATLQTSDPYVFAVGDCAHLGHAPRPKAGVFAVRAAPVLDHNLRTSLKGDGRLRTFYPQRDYLKLISLGDRRALADKYGRAVQGGWVWTWKDRIDRRFMAMLNAPMTTSRPIVPSDAATGLARMIADTPLCGACGAKLPASALTGALANLPPPMRPEILSGPGDDAAVLARAGGGRRVMTTDHLRGFTADFRRMGQITANHALGDIWAMGAVPEVALAQVILPRMAKALQAEALSEVMQAATAVFRAAGADIVGGHSSQGAEPNVGFTVTGLCDHPIPKGGLRPGDVLIVTKPIGSGIILAAEMAAIQLPDALIGDIWAGCMAGMERSLGPPAHLIAPHARAMTDVTGFGLAGHLAEMLVASPPCAIAIHLAHIPIYPGAEALAALGQASSLMPANRAAVADIVTAPQTPLADLLFDPQTCGGLLAAVPAEVAPGLVDALIKAGEKAAIIGAVVAGPRHITVT
jgi:selenide, water dikinase